jgi:hypothetical protein
MVFLSNFAMSDVGLIISFRVGSWRFERCFTVKFGFNVTLCPACLNLDAEHVFAFCVNESVLYERKLLCLRTDLHSEVI